MLTRPVHRGKGSEWGGVCEWECMGGKCNEKEFTEVECNALSAWKGVRRRKGSVWKVKRRQARKEEIRKRRNWRKQNVKE